MPYVSSLCRESTNLDRRFQAGGMSDSDTCQACGLATPAGERHNGWNCLLEMQRRAEEAAVPVLTETRRFRFFGHTFGAPAHKNQVA